MGDLILSPMDGVTDLPFRLIARRLGSSMSYLEYINVVDVLNSHPQLAKRLRFLENERPVVFQIFDDNPDRIEQAAMKLLQYNPDIIDINMGCPAKTVTHRGAGAALLKDPSKIRNIVYRLARKLTLPISAKIRLGWDETNRNYLEVAHIIEDSGAKLIAIHGRTRSQGFGGSADWDAIAEIKSALSIPVIGNGDVRTVADIERIKLHTNCDAVMIGRAAIQNPWLFARQDRSDVSIEQVLEIIREHLHLIIENYGPRGAVLFRKYLKSYLMPYKIKTSYLSDILFCDEIEAQIELIKNAIVKAQAVM